MNITLMIPLPVLIAGQYFKVRYRLSGSPAWIDLPNQTNASFVVNLSPGQYEFGFSLVLTDGTICEEVIQVIDVLPVPQCPEFDAEIIYIDRLYFLQVGVTFPSPYSPACGGYDIIYGIQGATTQTVHCGTLPSQVLLPATNNNYSLEIRAFNCDGTYVVCDTQVVVSPGFPCENASLISAEIVFTSGWFIRLTITQSNPYTNPFIVSYNQNNNLTSGVNDPGGTLNLAATALTTILMFPISPNLAVVPTNGEFVIYYEGSIVDGCQFTTKWLAQYTLT